MFLLVSSIIIIDQIPEMGLYKKQNVFSEQIAVAFLWMHVVQKCPKNHVVQSFFQGFHNCHVS